MKKMVTLLLVTCLLLAMLCGCDPASGNESALVSGSDTSAASTESTPENNSSTAESSEDDINEPAKDLYFHFVREYDDFLFAFEKTVSFDDAKFDRSSDDMMEITLYNDTIVYIALDSENSQWIRRVEIVGLSDMSEYAIWDYKDAVRDISSSINVFSADQRYVLSDAIDEVFEGMTTTASFTIGNTDYVIEMNGKLLVTTMQPKK